MRIAAFLSVLALTAGCGGADRPSSTGTPAPELTVEQAFETDPQGIVRVRGSLLAQSGEVRLCNGLAESYPPQCGRPSLRVEGLDLAELDGLQQAQGVTWSDREVALLGELEGDVLRIRAASR